MTAECPFFEPEPKRKPGELRHGDYVLATKYDDGDPRDQFAIGWYGGTLPERPDRHMVFDDEGKPFRWNGFRRCERVSVRVGNALVRAAPVIGDKQGYSVWYWRRHINRLLQFLKAQGK